MKVIDKTINSLLGEAGVNESERQVYLAGMGKPVLSSQLIDRTKLPRPTVLAALAELRSIGLCEATRRDGRSYNYTMLPIGQLKAVLGQRMRAIEQLMERIDTVDTGTTALDVQEFEGQEQVQKALELALRCKSREWKIISPRDNAIRHMNKNYITYFKRTRRERQLTSQTLWDAQWKDRSVSLQDVLMRKPRYIPGDLEAKVPSMLIAFDDKLLVIEGSTNPSAVIITSHSVVHTFGVIFEIAWRNCRT